MVVLLMKLVLSDEAEFRLLLGAVYETHLSPFDGDMAQVMLEENQSYDV